MVKKASPPDFFSRPILIDICKDGTISARLKGYGRDTKPLNNAALPVFSVDTPAQVDEIHLLFCRRQYTHHPEMRKGDSWYKWTDFSGELEAMDEVRDALIKWWDTIALPKNMREAIIKEKQKEKA